MALASGRSAGNGARPPVAFRAKASPIVKKPASASIFRLPPVSLSTRSAKNLREVVDFYDRRFNIQYTEQEKQDLVNFLSTL